jgi:hypothetical protein
LALVCLCKGMTLSLKLLLEVLPPPKHVTEVGQPDLWPTIEATLGLTLPSDYKAYINTFGPGFIREFVYVLNPFG